MKYQLAGIVVTVMMVLSGCTTTQLGGGLLGGRSDSETSVARVCNPWLVGLGAAAVCALITRGSNRILAAASCAAVALAACHLANSHRAEQTKTVEQVTDEFLKTNKVLPENPMVVSHSSRVDPSEVISVGQDVQVSFVTVVVPGHGGQKVKVEEELSIVDALGDVWGRPTRKVANPLGDAGEFHTSFTIPIRNGWSQGVYTVQRTVFLDGVVAVKPDSSTKFQVI